MKTSSSTATLIVASFLSLVGCATKPPMAMEGEMHAHMQKMEERMQQMDERMQMMQTMMSQMMGQMMGRMMQQGETAPDIAFPPATSSASPPAADKPANAAGHEQHQH